MVEKPRDHRAEHSGADSSPFLLIGGDDLTPQVTNIRPSTVVVGKQFDIEGKNLDLASEALFIKGATQIHLDLVRRGDNLWTVTTPVEDVIPDEYILAFKTRRGEISMTGRTVTVTGSAIRPTPAPAPAL